LAKRVWAGFAALDPRGLKQGLGKTNIYNEPPEMTSPREKSKKAKTIRKKEK
jgi:hypothetical protein